jgi:hypothetical protein
MEIDMIPLNFPISTYFQDPDAKWAVRSYSPEMGETSTRYYCDEFSAKRAAKMLKQHGHLAIAVVAHDSSDKYVAELNVFSYMDGLFT